MFSLIFIAAAAYLGYSPFFESHKDGIIVQILGASFGAVFLSILTYFLLNKQSEIEENKSRGQSVFEERVELYKSIMDETKSILIDGQISIKEMTQLQFMMVKLQMLSFDATIKSYVQVYAAISDAFSNVPEESEEEEEESQDDQQQEQEETEGTIITPEDKMKILVSLQQFASVCREELGLSQAGTTDTSVFETAMKELKKSQEAVETKKEVIKSGGNGVVRKQRFQYEFQGSTYKNATLASAVFAHYVKTNPTAGAADVLKAFSSFVIRGNPVLINAEEMKERNKGYAKPMYEKVKPKLADGTTIAMFCQWYANPLVEEFINFANSTLKYSIKKVERDSSVLDLVPTPEEMYMPLLQALKQMNGQAVLSEWLDMAYELGGVTKERLKAIEEIEYVSANFGSVINRTRQDLKRAGYVDNPERGKWVLVDPNLDLNAVTPELVSQRNKEFQKTHGTKYPKT